MGTHKLTPANFDRLRNCVKSQSGIAVADGKSYLIETRFSQLMEEEGIDGFDALCDLLEGSPPRSLVNRMIDAITTNETLWFRDDGPWEIIRQKLIPQWQQQLSSGESKKIRIWSAASSTGQEPYSIAMMIREYIEDEAPPGIKAESFEIFATDISNSALDTARAGEYELLAASRGITPEILERFFDIHDSSVRVKPAIQSMVRFDQFDLQRSFMGLGHFDLILCRNVLIYFANDLKIEIYGKIARSLTPTGALILGGAESAQGSLKLFKMARAGRHLYYTPRGKGEAKS